MLSAECIKNYRINKNHKFESYNQPKKSEVIWMKDIFAFKILEFN